MHRPTWMAALAAAMALSTATPASGQTVQERAEELNTQGKELFGQQKFEDALAKFRQAVVVDPRGKYYFNVCFTLTQLRRYRDALTACQAVEPNGADEDLLGKTNTLIARLQQQIEAEGQAGAGAGGGDAGGDPGGDTSDPGDPGDSGTGGGPDEDVGGEPAGPGAAGAGPGVGVAPPLAAIDAPATPRHAYEWGAGIELYGLNNVSVGGSLLDGEDRYGDGGFYMRGYAGILYDHARRLGGQAYIGYSNIPNDAIASRITDSALSIFDVGVAGTWHIALSQQLYLTPLLGAHVSFQGPVDSQELFIAAGGRAALSLDWVLGDSGRHVLSLNTGLNAYSRAGGESNGFVARDYGLDTGGLTAQIGLGYALRFQTPIGQIPVITLE